MPLDSSHNRLPSFPNSRLITARQPQAYLTQLRERTTLAGRAGDPNIDLMVEGAILHLQADLRWLDLCEERLERGVPATARGGLRKD